MEKSERHGVTSRRYVTALRHGVTLYEIFNISYLLQNLFSQIDFFFMLQPNTMYYQALL